MKRTAFTLAEVLITLAIVGVVAAMTIPTLIAKINKIVTDNQIKVFNAKLIKGLNLTKTAGDLNNTYTSTYDFLVNGLGKNLKMAKVCDKDHIRDCIPYDKIKYEDKSGNEKTIDVKDITTVSKLNLKAPYMDPAAFVLADGTPVIVSYNKECIDDPDKADTTINICLAGLYDLNGSRKPNKYLAKVETVNNEEVSTEIGDLRGFNSAYIGSSCAGQIGDFCFVSKAVYADDAMVSLIQAVDPSYTMPKFSNGTKDDYWQLAVDYCSKVYDGARLPTQMELKEIAKILYNTNNIYDSYQSISWNNTAKAEIFAALGIESYLNYFKLYSSQVAYGQDQMLYRQYYNEYTGFYSGIRNLSFIRAVCLGD